MTLTNRLLLLKIFSCFVLLFSSIGSSYGQGKVSRLGPKKAQGNTYALIVGISDYQQPLITDLRFAHRDAAEFSNFLMSKAGGAVPQENIRLLTNEQATVANIYIAKKWLETVAQQNDLVYFYFAGHGDVENSINQFGYLLSYDTPYQNYANNAVKIEDFNIMANTLSLEKEAKVILITDACHSGKLAGSDNQGRQLIGAQLSKAESKEIRIASCESDQLAQEDEVWGGGRGAFSYYLVKGLSGLADDGEKDGVVTLQEIKNYLGKVVPEDVGKFMQKDQNPVFTGKNIQKISIVDEIQLAKIQEAEATPVVESSTSGSREVTRALTWTDRYFLNLYQKTTTTKLEDAFDFEALRNQPSEAIIQAFLTQFPAELAKTVVHLDSFEVMVTRDTIYEVVPDSSKMKFDTLKMGMRATGNNIRITGLKIDTLYPEMRLDKTRYQVINQSRYLTYDAQGKLQKNWLADTVAFNPYVRQRIDSLYDNRLLEQEFAQNPQQKAEFGQMLAASIHNRVQQAINLYFSGDEAELEKARYYNSYKSGYDEYPAMMETAMRLLDSKDPLHRILEVKKYYFEGLLARMKMPLTANPKVLLTQAFVAQEAAFRLDGTAAYIQNELGVLHQLNKSYADAESYYRSATKLAPTWAIPWANLTGLYAMMNQLDAGKRAATIADSLKADIQNTAINLGVIYEKSGNLLLAEEYYRKAIDLNSRHFLPFERLGYVYCKTTQYPEADSCFHEADIRKKGYHFEGSGLRMYAVAAPFLPMPILPCILDTSILLKNDLMAYFGWGVDLYYQKDYANALRILKKVVAIDPKDPLVFHYLGKLYYDQQKWQEAELMFKFAIDYYLDQDELEQHMRQQLQDQEFPYEHLCFEQYYRERHYKKVEDFYFIASVYEQWNHYEEALKYYWQVFEIAPEYDYGAPLKAYKLLEKLGRYHAAEEAINSIPDEYAAAKELNQFYRNTIKKFPTEPYWKYALGMLLYKYAALRSNYRFNDTIVYFPKQNREVFLDTTNRQFIGHDPDYALSVRDTQGVVVPIDLQLLATQSGNFTIKGTGEEVQLADYIHWPRKDGIYYLLQAEPYYLERDTKGDIFHKVGEMYQWAGSNKQSIPYYQKALQLVPDHANTRMRLISATVPLYRHGLALEQLEILKTKSQLNFEHSVLLGKFWSHAGQFDQAAAILLNAKTTYPYASAEIGDLLGRLNLLAKRPKLAIPYYKHNWAVHQKDRTTSYSISKAYAEAGNPTEAATWLGTALKAGFNYKWVLDLDPSLAELRKTAVFKQLRAKMPPEKKYWTK